MTLSAQKVQLGQSERLFVYPVSCLYYFFRASGGTQDEKKGWIAPKGLYKSLPSNPFSFFPSISSHKHMSPLDRCRFSLLAKILFFSSMLTLLTISTTTALPQVDHEAYRVRNIGCDLQAEGAPTYSPYCPQK